jgi:Secretion system C-terminal sorting domain/Beta-propeller repeat/Fibronectin type III domain
VAVDASGNVYVTGGARNGGPDLDYITIKYNNSGVQQWALRYGNPNVTDAAAMIKLDQQGNIIVTGSSSNGNNSDYATIKYSPLGLVDWVQRYNAPGNGEDYCYSLAVDNSGNVYVAGYSTGSGTGVDCAALKYASNGAQQWVSRYSSPGVFNEFASSLTLDNSGNVYMTGSGSTSTNSGDYLTVKLDNSGTYQWAVRYNNGLPSGYHSAYHIICDSYGYLYVTGASSGASTDYASVKYNPANGDTIWTRRYDGPAAGYDQTLFMSLDNSGNVYVTGYSTGFGTMTDYATVKYMQAPNAPSGLTANGVTNNQINLNWSDNSNNEVRYLIERSTNAGANWLLRDSVNANITAYSDMGLLQNTIYHYRVRTYNSVGYTAYSNTAFDTTLNVTGIASNGEIPAEFKLHQNYPNPFNPVTKIKFDLPQSVQNVRLAVYDMLGRQVIILVNGQMQAGSYEVDFDGSNLANGTYFYKLTAGSFTEIKKMILIK